MYALVVTVILKGNGESPSCHGHTTIIPIGTKGECEKAKEKYTKEEHRIDTGVSVGGTIIAVVVPYYESLQKEVQWLESAIKIEEMQVRLERLQKKY